MRLVLVPILDTLHRRDITIWTFVLKTGFQSEAGRNRPLLHPCGDPEGANVSARRPRAAWPRELRGCAPRDAPVRIPPRIPE